MTDPFAIGRQAGIAAAQAWLAANKPIDDLLAAATELSHTRGDGYKAKYQQGYGFGMRTVLERAQERAA